MIHKRKRRESKDEDRKQGDQLGVSYANSGKGRWWLELGDEVEVVRGCQDIHVFFFFFLSLSVFI